KKNDVHFGNRISVKIVKNKVAPPFKTVELDLLFNEGISQELDLLDAALHFNVITKAGSWLSYQGTNFAQGREQALHYFKENPAFTGEISKNVQKKIQAQNV
ncbi:MAG: hypothetical protein WBQ73_03595, partial [Candidatus Babeliales bacterium]